MKKQLHKPFRFGFLLSAMLMVNFVVHGATFTAVTSGDWSNTLTWGGSVPSSTVLTDQITIPSGINVNMDSDITLNGLTSSINVMGTLTSSTTHTFTMLIGTLSGSGTITADDVTFGADAALLFTGSFTANSVSNSAFSLQSSATMMINQSLSLIAGGMSIQSGGSLTLAATASITRSGGQLLQNGGTLVLTSAYDVIYTTGDATTGVELSGLGLRNVTVNPGSANTVTLSQHLNLQGTLALTSGTLILNDYNLSIYGNLSGTGTISSTNISSVSVMTSNSLIGTLSFSSTGKNVNDLNIQVGTGNQVSLSAELIINGALNIISGELNLDNADLKIIGNISAGTGTISSDATSNIIINTATSPSGDIEFTSGSNIVGDFTVDISGGGSVMIASNMTINGALNLTAGKLNIQGNNLTLGASATIAGANSNSYLMILSSGSVTRSATLLVETTFPIGTSTGYFPASVTLNIGSSTGTVTAKVMDNVFASGTSGVDLSTSAQMVDATWDFESSISSNLNMDITLMWETSSEVNGFLRTDSYVSHYTSGTWDTDATSGASSVSAGMFSQTRANVTSLSPFAVFDGSVLRIETVENTVSMDVYPNPATDKISFSNTAFTQEGLIVEIVDIYGKSIGTYNLTDTNNTISVNTLPNGNYFIKVSDNNSFAVKQFTKI